MHPLHARTNKVKRIYASAADYTKSPSTTSINQLSSLSQSTTVRFTPKNSKNPNQFSPLLESSRLCSFTKSRPTVPRKLSYKRRKFSHRPKFNPTKSRYFTKFYQRYSSKLYKCKSPNACTNKKIQKSILFFSKKSSKEFLSPQGSRNSKVVLSDKCTGNLDKISTDGHCETDGRESLVKTTSGKFGESRVCARNEADYDSSRIGFLKTHDSSPMNYIFEAAISPQKVKCQLCQQLRDAKRYKRHLLMHVRHGKISINEMNNILFQTKYTRRNAKNRPMSRKHGYVCPILVNDLPCSAHVLDLQTHLRKIHAMSPSDVSFGEAIDIASTCERQVFYKSQVAGKPKYNPLMPVNNISDDSSEGYTNSSVREENLATIGEERATSVFEYPSDNQQPISERAFSSNFPKLVNMVPFTFEAAMLSFQEFLPTTLGGSNTQISIDVIISNLIILINGLGFEKLFDPQAINIHLTNESRNGKTPSTLINRVESLNKFLNYLCDYRRGLLPVSFVMERFLSKMKGIKKSLFKNKGRRQKQVMAKNREKYPESIEVLRQWRERRGDPCLLEMFDSFERGSLVDITKDLYTKLRDYLIVELVIPNGQRPGVICGVVISEVRQAKNDLTTEGFHKLFVADHKTGYMSSALLFIYPDIFHSLCIFIDRILPKLPLYISSSPTSKSHVFQTYSGCKMSSSRVTPLVREFLFTMGIKFNGTITDFRKAAATLTGKYKPDLHETMALFLGHSRKAHDRFYRIQCGHNGLSEAFKSLEIFHSNPDSTLSSSSIAFNSSPSLTELEMNPASSIIDLNESCSQRSLDKEFEHVSRNVSLLSNTNLHSPDSSFLRLDIAHSVLNSNDTSNQIQELRDQTDCNDTQRNVNYYGRSFSIPLTREAFIFNDGNVPIPSANKIHCVLPKRSSRNCPKIRTCCTDCSNSSKKSIRGKSNHKSIFHEMSSLNLFKNTFCSIFGMIVRHERVSKDLILQTARESSEFIPVYQDLISKYSQSSADNKIVSKVRVYANSKSVRELHCLQTLSSDPTIIMENDSSIGKVDSNLSEQCVISPNVIHSKSIFSCHDDEVLFRKVFYKYIVDISKKKKVLKSDIIIILDTDKRLTPLIDRIKIKYPQSAYSRLVTKVRTLGNSLR